MSVDEPLVKDVKSLFACVLRMHLCNQATVFWNTSREYRIMIRNAPDEPDTIGFEVCIVPDVEDDNERSRRLAAVLDLECDGFFDEGAFVVEAFSFPMCELSKDADLLDDARKCINALFCQCICPCGAYLIKDQAKMCFFCQMTHDPVNEKEQFCAICHECSVERHMTKQTCCGQFLHRACLAKWNATPIAGRACPLCRHVSAHVAHSAPNSQPTQASAFSLS